MHAASVGEYEQGHPVLEQLQQRLPHYRFLVTFFSPSGYDQKKKLIKNADVFYLPLDTAKNAQYFIQIVQPQIALFVKYEFWYHHLRACKKNGIPTLLFSARFQPNQWFFNFWLRPFGRKYLSMFFNIGVQDDFSMVLLEDLGRNRAFVAFDTRYDRVALLKENNSFVPILDVFKKGKKRLLVAGSTYPIDESFLIKLLDMELIDGLVLVPHEIQIQRIDDLQRKFPGRCTLLSHYQDGKSFTEKEQILILDGYGLLSKTYRFADITYVGGGFGKGIHNVLEAAVYGKPVLFGPNYHRFIEAEMLIESKGAFSAETEEEMIQWFIENIEHPEVLEKMGHNSYMQVQLHRGGTQKVIQEISKILTFTAVDANKIG
jgi:3-deoxy-D-manno-octulosonic-acid transferase